MGDWQPTQTIVYRGREPNNYDYTLRFLWVIGKKDKEKSQE